MNAPILMGLIYLFVCWIAGNVWFEWKLFLILIGIEFLYDIIITWLTGELN